MTINGKSRHTVGESTFVASCFHRNDEEQRVLIPRCSSGLHRQLMGGDRLRVLPKS